MLSTTRLDLCPCSTPSSNEGCAPSSAASRPEGQEATRPVPAATRFRSLEATCAVSVVVGVTLMLGLATVTACSSTAREGASLSGVPTFPPADSVSSPPADSVSSPPADNVSSPPADSVSSPPVNSVSSPPADNVSSPPADSVSSSESAVIACGTSSENGDNSTTSCPILIRVDSSTSDPSSPSLLVAYRIASDGRCRAAPADARFIVSSPSSEPRYLGFPNLTVLHPGDILLGGQLGTSGPAWQLTREDNPLEAIAHLEPLDKRFKRLRGDVPQGSMPLKDLSKATNGTLEALGIFDYQDMRPSDGPETLRVLVRAALPGDLELKIVQLYTRDLRRGAGEEKGQETRVIKIRVVPAGTAITTRYGEGAFDSESLELGTGDLLTLPISLGYMNRGGIETRGPAGVQVSALDPAEGP